MKRAAVLARGRRDRQSGYALLMLVFMVATLILIAAAATPNVLIDGRRIQEQEEVWRGNQYVRAIRLYYQKNGRYPQTLEDLAKASNNGTYFLRKQYTDLFNTDDGKWRMIYVTGSGQLIGSVRYHSLQEMAGALGFSSLGTVVGGANGTGIPASGPGAAATSNVTAPGQTSAFGPTTQQPQSLAPLEPVDGPVLGGFLIGVGSKVKKNSLMVYQGGKTYFEWEFIWNPLATANGAGQLPGATPAAAGAATQPGGTQINGAQPNGSQPASGANGTPGATAPAAPTTTNPPDNSTANPGTAPATTPETAPQTNSPANPPASPPADQPPPAAAQ